MFACTNQLEPYSGNYSAAYHAGRTPAARISCMGFKIPAEDAGAGRFSEMKLRFAETHYEVACSRGAGHRKH